MRKQWVPVLAAIAMAVGAVAPALAQADPSVRLHGVPPAPTSVTARTEGMALDAYGKLPLAFVPNAGQTDPRVRYSAQAAGAIFYFTPSEAVFAFTEAEKGLALRLAFLGANPAPQIAGALPGTGTFGGGTDAFVTKLDPSGSALVVS